MLKVVLDLLPRKRGCGLYGSWDGLGGDEVGR